MSLLHPAAQIVDARNGTRLRGAELRSRIDGVAAALESLPSGVIFLRFPLEPEAVIRYVAAWETGRPVVLMNHGLDAATEAALIVRYEPAAVLGLGAAAPGPLPDGYEPGPQSWLGRHLRRTSDPTCQPHPDLAILLPTSGSTGDPKLVRLSREAILANTTAIVDVLGISGDDVAITTLPFHYSYGMSVLNTHLAVGATVVLESRSLLLRDFWRTVDDHGATSLAMVPTQTGMIARLGLDLRQHDSVRTVTQAGGRAAPHLLLDLHERLNSVNGRLFVMYGQTEAGPRMTTLPADDLPLKPTSVGPALPGGRLSVLGPGGEETATAGQSGEVIYRGSNVMMGYASQVADLALGDVQGGRLETGDVGHLDQDGYLHLEGRQKRIGKVAGIRLNLDDIEAILAPIAPVAAIAGDDRIVVWIQGGGQAEVDAARSMLSARLRLHGSGFDLRTLPEFPMLSNGKIDYLALAQRA